MVGSQGPNGASGLPIGRLGHQSLLVLYNVPRETRATISSSLQVEGLRSVGFRQLL